MFADLNPSQRDAVETLRGPLLVLAGAGTGKTRVVTYRIANLIRHRTSPERILAVTFTKKAAAEMKDRAAKLLGKKRDEVPEISTFHSLCVRILRRHIRRLGYPEHFAIYDRGDQEALARNALREMRVGSEVMRPGDLLAFISRWKCASVRPNSAVSQARTDKEHLAASAYRRYQNALKTAGAVDFDDLLLLTEDLFAQYGDVRRDEANRFDHLLIDEYQDTNASQYAIVKSLAAGHRNLCVVGDDDQSIYGWRGAEVEHILNFRRDWPECKVVRLEENYRSTAAILELANRVIAHNKVRHDKVLRPARPGGMRPQILQFPDETAEAEQTIESIKSRLTDPTVQPRDIAILFRTNEQPRPFEAALRKAKLPYILIGGMSFYDRKEVRDVLAYLKLLATLGDEVATLRIINTPPRGIGQSTVAALMEHAVSEGKRLWDVLAAASRLPKVSPAAAEGIKALSATIGEHRRRLEAAAESKRGGETLTAIATSLIAAVKYREEIERLYPAEEDRVARWNSVEEVINSLASYEQKASKRRPTLQGFLDDLLLAEREDEDDKESQLSRNAIALMTLHSAKGLEFPEVYLVGMEEGLLPHHRSVALENEGHDAAIDEERRLCYVGITRAQQRLTFSMALTRMKWGKPRDSTPSRFLFEITGQPAGNPVPKPRGKRPVSNRKEAKAQRRLP
ncbi:MAG: AAA family ATPase [Planctomycetota bacterium]|nr:MAG: AAA family ATPase [Planctomycetota bacterium]